MSMKKILRIFKWVGIILVGIVILLVTFVTQPWVFLPHDRIEISLPFAPENDAKTGIIPMGETIFHPKPQVPNGHPGIDFQWNYLVPIISSSDGKVVKINHGSTSGIDVTVQSGYYELRYKELDEDSLPANIKAFGDVKKGDLIGYPGGSTGGDGNTHYQVHWEFASTSLIRDRFCPLTYFDADSLSRINKIWDAVSLDYDQGVKRQFPYICSGDYFNKTE
jgi:murein DD-endopeptidase MepM/ murein hydrolase activator NlpD